MVGILLYLVIVIGLAVFSVLYIDSFAVILLACSLFIPLLLGLTFLITHRKGSADLSCNLDLCHTGDSIPVTLTVENHGILPFSHMQADVMLRHQFGECDEELCLRFPLQARNLTRVTFYVHAEYSGILSIRMKRLFIRDYFHLFSMRFPMPEKKLVLTVLPAYLPLPFRLDAPAVYTPEGDHFGDHPGDDPSEIFDLRAYRQGDLMSRIHWKLSARRDELIYKEFSFPEEHRVLLLFDYQAPEKGTAYDWGRHSDAAFTLLYSIASYLLAKEVPFRIVWCNIGNKLEIREMQSEADLIPVFRYFYETLGFTKLPDARLKEFLEGEELSSAVCITSELTPQLLHTIDVELAAFRKTILCVGSAPTLSADHTDIIPVPVSMPAGEMSQLIL